ncbi:MAG: PLP-dependent aminotransferase family protein [Clostridiaceae bacterium]
MDIFNINFNEYRPKYLQVSDKIKNLINSNILKDKEKLPSIRALALKLNVNNITVKNAYKKLMEEGYVDIAQGSGTYVNKIILNSRVVRDYKDTLKKITASADEFIDFTKESLNSDYFPIESFKEIIMQVLNTYGAEALLYEETLGFMPLREIISEKFWNGSIDKDNILILSGAQQGIDLASKVLVNINSNIVLEKPTYNGALNVFRWRRANIYDIDIKEDGIDINTLEQLLKKKNIELVYLMTYFQNPTGITCSDEKKRKLLYLANKYDFYIIEDDYLSELIYSKNIKHNTLKSMDKNDRVIYIKSFSKIFLPGIRLGYLITPEKLKDSFQNFKINTDIATSSLMQRTLSLYMEKDYWIEHVRRMNTLYSKKYKLTDKILNSCLKEKIEYIDPKGGLSFYLKLKDNVKIDTNQLFYLLKKKNVIISPSSIYYKNPQDGLRNFRISFSSLSDKQIEDGLYKISQVLE